MFHLFIHNLRSNVARPITVHRQSEGSVDQGLVFFIRKVVQERVGLVPGL
jgi:hypothetical protein